MLNKDSCSNAILQKEAKQAKKCINRTKCLGTERNFAELVEAWIKEGNAER